jgi:hypothetical protein
VFAAYVAACDQDPFGLSERTVAGNYRLKKWEDGETFYLTGGHKSRDASGQVEGSVVRIGWTQSHILVDRLATFRGDPDGVMVIDVERQMVTGPVTEETIAADPRLSSIKLMKPAEAWAQLR